jgi:hypothetical protein
MIFARLWVFLIVLTLVFSKVDGSRTSVTGALKRLNPASSPDREPLSTSTPCTGMPVVSADCRACGFYIWDAPSTLLYKWCHRLLKDHRARMTIPKRP